MHHQIIVALILSAAAITVMGQGLPPKADPKPMMTNADNSKSMTRQEGVTNFMQAVASNLTSSSKSAQLKASIFALNPLDSAHKYSSQYYLDHTWQRHTTVMLGGGMDANSNFNSISAGFTFDLLHKQDASEVRTFDNDMKLLYIQISNIEADVLKRLQEKIRGNFLDSIYTLISMSGPEKDRADLRRTIILALVPASKQDSVARHDATFGNLFITLWEKVEDARRHGNPVQLSTSPGSAAYLLADYLSTIYYATPLTTDFFAYLGSITEKGKEPPLPDDIDSNMFKGFITDINVEVKQHVAVLHGKDLVEVYTYIQKEYKRHVNRIKLRPLLTLGYNYTYNKDVLQNQHLPSGFFLVGFCDPDRPYQFSFNFTDSASTDTTHTTGNHNIMVFQPGISKVFAIDANAASLFEAGFTLEYDRCTSSIYDGQKRDNLLPTLTFQARPTATSPWIKLVVKRDTNAANFLGFLNVTFNLDNPSGK